MTEPSPDQDRFLVLPPSLDMNAAVTLHAELRGLVAGAAPLVIDGGAVERASTACVQLLAASALAAREHGQSLRITPISPILQAAIQDLDLCTVLQVEPA